MRCAPPEPLFTTRGKNRASNEDVAIAYVSHVLNAHSYSNYQFSMELKTALAVLTCVGFGVCSYAPGQVPNPIPASRKVDWSRVGLPGGIPNG